MNIPSPLHAKPQEPQEPQEPQDPITGALSGNGNKNDDPSPGIQDEDRRDQYFGGDNEQTYSAPSAPVLTPPLEDSEEVQATRQENINKTQMLRPLNP